LQQAFQDAANDAGIVTESVALPFYIEDNGDGTNSAQGAIEALKRLEYRHVFCILFESSLEPVMKTALDLGAYWQKNILSTAAELVTNASIFVSLQVLLGLAISTFFPDSLWTVSATTSRQIPPSPGH